jgi:hypothetical protein
MMSLTAERLFALLKEGDEYAWVSQQSHKPDDYSYVGLDGSWNLEWLVEQINKEQTEPAPEGDDNPDKRECSRCGDEVSVLNSRDECMGCEEERSQHAALERQGRETVRKGTALAEALAELDRDGYVHLAAGGNFRPTGIRSDKRLYSKRTIDALGEFIPLEYTGYATYGRTT